MREIANSLDWNVQFYYKKQSKPALNSTPHLKSQIKFKSANLRKFKEILTVLGFTEIHERKEKLKA